MADLKICHLKSAIALLSDMSAFPSVQEASQILNQFPCASGWIRIIPQGNRGGFSGARLWRIERDASHLCLRAWPTGQMPPERLTEIHHLMAKAGAAGLTFVPAVLTDRAGGTWVEAENRLWDLTTWMPGQADFHQKPSQARVGAAFVALARLHLAWASIFPSSGPCSGIQRRLEAAHEWQALIQSGWRPSLVPGNNDPVQHWAERAWPLLQKAASKIIDQLRPWASRSFFLQPCLCDIWHDHVLFDGDAVTGIVDYGSVKVDHVPVDLARLLGSLIGDDAELRSAALRAYSSLRPISFEEEALITALDETGTVVGAMNWLRWLYLEARHYEDRNAVARKLAELVKRMEGWAH